MEIKKILSLLIVVSLFIHGNSQTTGFRNDGGKMEENKPIALRENILIKNVEIFTGKDTKTFVGNLLIVGNMINKVSSSPISIPDTLTVKAIRVCP